MLNKPIKRNESIKKLSRDHHFSLLFCWKIRQGLKASVDLERIRKYVNYFWQQHFSIHFWVEEKIFFTAVRDRHVQRAINEHKRIRHKIVEIENYSEVILEKKLAELADIIEEHVRYEERHLFPHLEIKLSEEQLENVRKRLERRHHLSFADEYEDRFWNVK